MDLKERAEALARLSLQDIYARRTAAVTEMAHMKAAVDELNAEIQRRFEASAVSAFGQAGKDSGQLKLSLQDGFALECKIDKKVEWDSDKLMAVAQTMPWDRVQAIFKIAFAVPEKIYGGIAAVDPGLKAKIDDARTVKLSPVKVTLVKEG